MKLPMSMLHTTSSACLHAACPEAMGACRPILTCDSGGPLESVLHCKTGFHCKPIAGVSIDAHGACLG